MKKQIFMLYLKLASIMINWITLFIFISSFLFNRRKKLFSYFLLKSVLCSRRFWKNTREDINKENITILGGKIQKGVVFRRLIFFVRINCKIYKNTFNCRISINIKNFQASDLQLIFQNVLSVNKCEEQNLILISVGRFYIVWNLNYFMWNYI